jgi:hypothetical protein
VKKVLQLALGIIAAVGGFCDHVNAGLGNVIGWALFVVILIVALAAIPLMLITQGGSS